MASTSAAIPSKGSLKRTPFPKLMRALHRGRATGSLYLLNGETKKVVFFKEGRPTFVRSNVLEECLGQILAHEGLITQQQCDQTLEAIRRTGKKQGELLVEMGILSAGNLRYGLESQLRRKLFDIFAWTEGRFQFKAGAAKDDHGLRLDTSTPGLIAAAVLQQADAAGATKALELFADRYVQAKPDVVDKLGLQPADRHFFSSLDGSKTAATLVEEVDAAERDDRTLLLHALVSAGVVNLPKEAQAPSDAPPPPPDHSERPDAEFSPGYAPSSDLKPFEDTPLPGELPKRDAENSVADADIDEAFARVASEDSGSVVTMDSMRAHNTALVDQALLDAEPDTLDEQSFDDEIEVIEDAELELIEEDVDDELSAIAELPEDSHSTLEFNDNTEALNTDEIVIEDDLIMDPIAGGDMLSIDELDDVELDGDLDDVDLDAVDLGDGLALGDEGGVDVPDDADPEMLGAMRYSEGEASLNNGDWAAAQAALEQAYEYGVDIAELHAMLAYARFKSDEHNPDMAEHALDLLNYAASMNPNLDIIYAFKGDLLLTRGDHNGARAAAAQALRLNEYNDLALNLMDRLG